MSEWSIIARGVGEIVAGTAAIVAGVKAWLADSRTKRIEKDVTEIKIAMGQQQAQKQTQNITVNVDTGKTGTGARTAIPETFILSSPNEEPPPE